MKKVFVLIGSRRKEGNTIKFVKKITEMLDESETEIEYAFPQEYKIEPCIGCVNCFIDTHCVRNDDIELLQENILESDLFIIASPVYIHYFTSDLKLMLDRSAWWTHTLRLQGKPVVVISTCNSNGFDTVTKPLSEIITYMGGNVIAKANASYLPNQINNSKWLAEVSQEIAKRIKKYLYLPPQSNRDLEKLFPLMKSMIMQQADVKLMLGVEPGEYNYWKETGMLEYDSFTDYLRHKIGEGN